MEGMCGGDKHRDGGLQKSRKRSVGADPQPRRGACRLWNTLGVVDVLDEGIALPFPIAPSAARWTERTRDLLLHGVEGAVTRIRHQGIVSKAESQPSDPSMAGLATHVQLPDGMPHHLKGQGNQPAHQQARVRCDPVAPTDL